MTTTTGSKQVAVNLDFGLGTRPVNMPGSTGSGEAVEHDQFNAGLNSKQDPVIPGSGVAKDGDTLSVDLATSGSDYGTLDISGVYYASLNGIYTRLPYTAMLEYSGLALDLTYGDTSIEWNAYYKDNGGGVWAICVKRDIDGSENTNPESGTWLAALTTTDPTALSFSGSGTATVSNMLPNYQAVDHEFITYSNESSGDGRFSPSSTSGNVEYAVGNTPAGLVFSNDKLAVDFAGSVEGASSTKVFPSSVVKTYIDESITSAKDSSNNVFSNSVAAFAGSPANVQTAIEAAAAELDAAAASISALTAVNSVQDTQLASAASTMGVPLGSSDLGSMSAAGVSEVFLSNTATSGQTPAGIKDTLIALATRISEVYQSMGETLGLASQETDFGEGFIILPNDSDAKALFQATEAELQQLALGAGQFWQPVEAYSSVDVSVSNPGTATFGGAAVAIGERVLLLGQTDASENGIYLFDTSSSPMVRAQDADADAEFTPNKTVQVLNSSAEGISGATFAYQGDDSPAVGIDDLAFALRSQGVIGDNAVTEQKLTVGLSGKINAKADKYAETIVITAGTPYNVAHGLDSTDVLVQVRDSSGNVLDMEVDVVDSDYVTINSPVASGSFRVIVIG